VRRCSRDVALGAGVLLLESFDDDPAQRARLTEFAELVSVPVIVSSTVPLQFGSRAAVRLDLPAPDVPELQRRWAQLLEDGNRPQLALLARTFRLDHAGFEAVRRLVGSAAGRNEE